MFAQSVCTTSLMLGMVGGAIGCSEILNIDAFSDGTTTAVGGGGSGGSGGAGGMAGTDLPAPTWVYPGKVEDLVVTLAPSRLFQRGVVASAAASIAFCTIDADLADQNAKDALSNDPGCPNSPVIETTPYSVINPLQPERAYYAKLRACADPNATVCGPWSDVLRADTDNSVIGWWRLDDAAGATAVDSSPAGNDGSLENFDLGTAWESGLVLGALRFDDTDSYINLGNNYNFASSDAFTIEAWLRRASIGSGHTIFAKEDLIDPMAGRGYWFGFLPTNELYFEFFSNLNTGNRFYLNTSTQFNTPDEPQHVALTYDGSSMAGGTQFFVNSVEQMSTIGADLLTGPTPTSVPSRIGGTMPVGGMITDVAGVFDGLIDDVIVYDRPLSLPELVNTLCARETLNREETGDPSPLPTACEGP